MYSYNSQSLNDSARTYVLVMTYEGNRTINMTLVMMYLKGNKFIYLFNNTFNIIFFINDYMNIRNNFMDPPLPSPPKSGLMSNR